MGFMGDFPPRREEMSYQHIPPIVNLRGIKPSSKNHKKRFGRQCRRRHTGGAGRDLALGVCQK